MRHVVPSTSVFDPKEVSKKKGCLKKTGKRDHRQVRVDHVGGKKSSEISFCKTSDVRTLSLFHPKFVRYTYCSYAFILGRCPVTGMITHLVTHPLTTFDDRTNITLINNLMEY